MKTIKAFIKSHQLLSYFTLTFAISWSGFLMLVGLGTGSFSPTPEQLQTLVPYAVPAMLAGPPVAGILLTGLVYGRAGLRELLSRLLRWRVGAHGVGLRPYPGEPARGDAHARKSRGQHDRHGRRDAPSYPTKIERSA